jgi:hypothetical protein
MLNDKALHLAKDTYSPWTYSHLPRFNASLNVNVG